MPKIQLQPKQLAVYEEMRDGFASWFGLYGGRGAAKSFCIDAIAIAEMIANPGSVSCIIMRTFEQVRKYHIEPLLRTWPELQDHWAVTKKKLKLPNGSELDIGYAENYQAVENFFRSGNYRRIYIDQAEQFTEMELREIKKANRWPGDKAKTLLAFNMGGIGIGFLRKIFHDKQYNERENPDNYASIKANPWDNCFWVLDALNADGLTISDYYSWTDKQRMDYAAERGEYTNSLNSEDDAIRARDWFGSWDSLEGAYFGKVFDPQHTIVSQFELAKIAKPWWKRWMSGDWGGAHYTSMYWHMRGEIQPKEAFEALGLRISKPISCVVTYREYLEQGLTDQGMAAEVVARCTDAEVGKAKYDPLSGVPERVKAVYFSPDAFEMSKRQNGQNTIADQISNVFSRGGLPPVSKARNSRVSGWRAMYGLLGNTQKAFAGEDVDCIWLIADNCPELIKAIPLAMRDPKKLEDIIKTDLRSTDIVQDALDGCRYGILCREVSDNSVPPLVQRASELARFDNPQDRYIANLMLDKGKRNRSTSFNVGSNV